MFNRACALAATAWLAAAPVAAQMRPQPEIPSVPVVTTTGEGLVRKAPDRAWVTIAAETRARTAPEAQRGNTEAMTGVTAKIKASGIPSDAMQTTGYTLQPEFDYANGRQTLRGYAARNQLQVRVDTLAKLGEIIDAAVSVGATNVSSIRFDLQDRDTAEREALRQAVTDARARADAVAAGAGQKVDHVLRIEEQRDSAMPPRQPVPMYAARSEAVNVAVPIESGEIEVRAHVTLTAAIK
jgi:uncharacterized protein YggE